ncbi:MAG TPA: kelch repeat-containing protein [Thermoplasmata archaeon]|nr:kelch repeat-containing protein [Thermoplasmata archaeon]
MVLDGRTSIVGVAAVLAVVGLTIAGGAASGSGPGDRALATPPRAGIGQLAGSGAGALHRASDLVGAPSCTAADAQITGSNTSSAGTLSLPANGCSYAYLAIAEGASITSTSFPGALSLSFAGNTLYALGGVAEAPVASIGTSGPASVQFTGIGVSVVLRAVANQTVATGTGANVSFQPSKNAFYAIVAVGSSVSTPVSASYPFAVQTTVGTTGAAVGAIITGAVGPGPQTVHVQFAPPSTGGSGSSVTYVVFQGDPPAMDWDSAPIALPNGSLGRVGGEGSGLVVDSADHAALLFGGATATGLSNATLVENTSNGTWTAVAASGAPAPSPRSNFSLIDIGGKAVLFGGLLDSETGGCGNDTWVFDFATDRWSNVSLPRAPPPREQAAGAYGVFASLGFVLLEGGIDPALPLRGGLATVYWNDTWLFNITSHRWSGVAKAGAPSPRAGSSMAYVPPLSGFVLFGGCARVCTNGSWVLRPGTWHWAALPTSGPLGPPSVGGAAFAWDPIEGALVTFGGYELSQGTPVPTSGTLALSVPGLAWGPVAAPGLTPSPRFLAASAWLDTGACAGLDVIGGNLVAAGFAPDGFLLDSSSRPESANDSAGGVCGSDPVPVPKIAPTELAVHVRTTAAAAIAGARVNLTLPFPIPRGTYTDQDGWANFTAVPPGPVMTNVTAAGFAPVATIAHVVFGAVTILNVTLDLYGRLTLHVSGVGYAGVIYPIDLAFVRLDALSSPGVVHENSTDPNGTTHFVVAGAQTYAFNIAAYGFHNATSGIGGFSFVGVPENRTNTTVVLLTPLNGSSITVYVRDVVSGRPVPTANITFTLPLPVHPAVIFGTWPVDANGSRYLAPVPPATYRVAAVADGYQPNSTAVRVLVGGPPVTATIFLTPNQTEGTYCGPFIAPCPGWGTPDPGLNAPFGSPASLASSTFWAFVAVPIGLVAMGLVEALALRRRGRRIGSEPAVPGAP